MKRFAMVIAAAPLLLGGCAAASAIGTVVTAPVRIGAKAVDLATTSQSESDEKRGREMRRREEQLGKLERDYARQDKRCAEGDETACARRDGIRAEMDALLPGVPYEPR